MYKYLFSVNGKDIRLTLMIILYILRYLKDHNIGKHRSVSELPCFLTLILYFQIDCETIRVIDEDQLEKFIPCVGDRIAIKHYCRVTIAPKNTKYGVSKMLLVNKLRAKMKLPDQSISEKEEDVVKCNADFN